MSPVSVQFKLMKEVFLDVEWMLTWSQCVYVSVCMTQMVGIPKMHHHTHVWPPDPGVTTANRGD